MPSSRSHKKESRSRSRSRSCSKSRSRSRSKSPEKKFEWCDIYQYFKNRLVGDKELMIAGSDSYTNVTNSVTEIIPTNHAVTYDTPVINYNIDYIAHGSPFFVREDGIYVYFFVISVDTACQFTLFVNGQEQKLTCGGTNSGAGQVILRGMLQLKKNDQVVMRNYITTANSLTSLVYAGGSQVGNSSTMLLLKIAPLNPPKLPNECECKHLCLPHSKKRLFKKVEEALLCDHELMVKGFDIAGTFCNGGQLVPLEGDVAFSSQHHVTGLQWNISNPSQVIVQEDGVYKMFFLVTEQTAAQFAFAVNGVPIESTTQGTNKGSGQLTSRGLFTLYKGDIVTVRNHSSQNGTVQITDKAGGANVAISIIMTVFKIAPICKPVHKEVPKCVQEAMECWYDKLKTYLLCKEYLQIAGSKAYSSVTDTVVKTVPQNGSFYWSTPVVEYKVAFRPGDTFVKIEKTGLYDIFTDIATNEPLQMCLFVNGVPDISTNFGRDSGGNRCAMRQFVALNKGDIVSVHNYLSTSANVTTISNAGGNNIGNNAVFMLFYLHPLCLE